ncbi:MAG: hypothetical protein ACPLRZ_07710 [Thermovenabulum sp.]|uniref:hypothetical protein n=1 Tax=Thermovenabulum sp. TaxID=3100335 RepID=UPI003C79E974
MKVFIGPDVFTGNSAKEIVEAMRQKAFFYTTSLDEYMEAVADNLGKVFTKESLEAEGKTIEERCENFLKKLQSMGFLTIEEGI